MRPLLTKVGRGLFCVCLYESGAVRSNEREEQIV